MALIKSGSREAVGTNISELVHSGRPQKQAVAIALNNARQYGAKFASGGTPMGERMAAHQLFSEGFLHSSVPGRTDKLPIAVHGGAYVLPADHISTLGQGNSLAGADIVKKMFKSGPYGSTPSPQHGIRPNIPRLNLSPRTSKSKFASGGSGKTLPIIVAGGEVVLSPEQIVRRFGSLEAGHKALDKWVIQTRKKNIKTLRGLRPPKKD